MVLAIGSLLDQGGTGRDTENDRDGLVVTPTIIVIVGSLFMPGKQ